MNFYTSPAFLRRKPRRSLGTLAIGWGLTLLATIICFIPAEILGLIYFLSNPANFWEKFAVLGVGLFLGGGFQIFLLVCWIIALNYIWTEFCCPERKT